MPDTTYLIAAVLLAASITFALRALPLADRGGAAAVATMGAAAMVAGLHRWRSNAVVNLF